MLLKNKTVIVTGASSGIGAAAARLFALEGANVVLGARRGELLDEQVSLIAEHGGNATALAGDVREDDYAAALVRQAKSEFGGLDCAFNNAGIVGEMSPVPAMNSENWDKVITTNLTSAFFAAKHQIPALEERGGGSIVFTSSFVGVTNGGMPGMAAYAASKAGLVGLVQSLSGDHAGECIRINALLPGGTITAMTDGDAKAHAGIASLHALKRMAEPEEIARAALFLL